MAKGPDKSDEILNALIRGGEKAVSEFDLISGGEWFDEAPEYFLTSHVAMSIRNFEKTYALMEVSVDQSRKDAGANRKGRPADHERRNGRFDCVIYWANDKPRGVVEVKSPIWVASENKLQPDFSRVCSALTANPDASFQFGAFLFYASVSEPERKHDNATQKLRELLDRVEERAKTEAGIHGIRCTPHRGTVHRGNDKDGGAWCISSVIFSR